MLVAAGAGVVAIAIVAGLFAVAAGVSWTAFAGVQRSLTRFAVLGAAAATDAAEPSVAAANDLAELAPAAEEFDRLVRTVREAADELRDAAEQNAHAFKTPIAVISQSLEPLRRSVPEDDTRGRRALQLIERSVDRLDSLVGAARHMDEILASLIDMPRERVNVSALLTRMLHAYRDRISEQGVVLRSEVAPGLAVMGGEENLEVVVEHVVENAVSFSQKGGTVSVTLGASGDDVRLIVEDEGPGVDPRNFERIFDRYFTHRPGQDASTHFGIGLWVVRRNVSAMGGRVDVANRGERGFAVTVTMPVAR
ncbi:MAG TPA: HAMP domain-containing sensor histidine kinase [Alphaproteobacteria bacterium]|nr:HAMP domain-containing sensor histidine kinase [Alphaproteobacteria bacterium]